MSVNDLLNDDSLLLYMGIIFIIIMIFAIPAGISKGKKTNAEIYGEDDINEVINERNAKVVAIRTKPHPLSPTVSINTIMFEFSDGNRVELAVKDADIIATTIEGDEGTLSYQGNKFISFERTANQQSTAQ